MAKHAEKNLLLLIIYFYVQIQISSGNKVVDFLFFLGASVLI